MVGETNVYGVQLPNHDGRAGCAAIPKTAWEKVNPDEIAKHVINSLPTYARPIFIRIVKEYVLFVCDCLLYSINIYSHLLYFRNSLEVTGTSKHMKSSLRKEGVDPRLVKDPLYWLKNGKYVLFRDRDWDSVIGGKVKL